MDKNTLTGVVLMMAVLFGFMYCNQPSAEEIQARKEQAAQQARQDSIKAVQAQQEALTIREITEANQLALREGMATYGARVCDSVRSLSKAEAYDLRLVNDSVIEGVIRTAGGEIKVNDVIEGNYPEEMSQLQRAEASRHFHEAIADMSSYRHFASHLDGADEVVGLKNNVLSLELSTKGGQISSATLLDYKDYRFSPDTIDINLWDGLSNSYSFTLRNESHRFNSSDFYFTPEVSADSTSVLMKLDLGGGAWWGLRYSFPEADGYYVDMEVVQHGMAEAGVIPDVVSSMEFAWEQRMKQLERGRVMEQRNSALYYKEEGDDVDNLSEMKSDDETVDVPLKWIAFKNQFFSSILIADGVFNSNARLESAELANDSDYIKKLSAKATIDYSVAQDEVAKFHFFLGPNLYPVLRDMDRVSPEGHLDLTRVIPLGWSLFRWINTGFIIPVFTFLSKYISNYGIIILVLTLLIKLILFPFTYKTYRSQAKMRILGPEIKAINEQYPGKENAMVRQQKTMALYSKAGVNPMGGCLPMLLQMPILVAMFSFFPSCIELRGQSFLWAQDLASPDAVITWSANIPVISWLFDNHLSLFCLLMTVTNIIYSKLMMQSQPGGASMPGMKLMTYGMPLMFLFWFNNYAAGLSYYYFLSLLITIVQTYVIRHWVIDENKVRAEMEANAKKPRKKNGWLARMEEAQRKQQALMREQAKKQNRRR